MKKHHLIFLSTFLFLLLFYEEYLALNLGLFGIFLSILTYFKTKEPYKTKTFLVLFVTSILSPLAFAWYGDFVSFLAVISSLFLFRFTSTQKRLKPVLYPIILFLNAFTFIGRFFNFEQWLERRSKGGLTKKAIVYFLIPGFFVILFFGAYSLGSSHFADFFSLPDWDFDIVQIITLSILGFFLTFIFWNYGVERFIYKQNRYFNNNFSEKDKALKPTYSFLDADSERTTGIISFIALNVLLIIFIITYNYEQFFEVKKTAVQLSDETHERVNAVILSIVMAISVIMFFFKAGFNFDIKAKYLKIFVKIWIFLNAVLVISAALKNAEYILNLGLTYKRLGVYAFLSLAIIGLMITFMKIRRQKTNAFLFNQMLWVFYGLILVCSYINWGGIITSHNMKRKDFSLNFHVYNIDFNNRQLLDYAEITHNGNLETTILNKINSEKQYSFLSKTLYYESVKTK